MPWQQTVPGRHRQRVETSPAQVDFHPVALKVADAHGTSQCREKTGSRGRGRPLMNLPLGPIGVKFLTADRVCARYSRGGLYRTRRFDGRSSSGNLTYGEVASAKSTAGMSDWLSVRSRHSATHIARAKRHSKREYVVPGGQEARDDFSTEKSQLVLTSDKMSPKF